MSVFVSPAQGRVTSRWGRRDPLPYHYGIDIAPPIPGDRNWPFFAAYAGKVVAVNDGSSRNTITGGWNTGSYIKVDGKKGSEWYGHYSHSFVKVGDYVEAGDMLGIMGAVGNVTGIHLHFESWDHHYRSPHDPMIDFNRHGVTPGSKPIIPSTDWFNMATKKDLQEVIGEMMLVTLTDVSMRALVTDQRVWDMRDLFNVLAHRTGLTFQRVGQIRDELVPVEGVERG